MGKISVGSRYGMAGGIMVLFVAVLMQTAAYAQVAPPYEISRSFADIEEGMPVYGPGEPIIVTVSIITVDAPVGASIRMEERFSAVPGEELHGFAFQPNERITVVQGEIGPVFTITLDESFPSPFEFQYRLTPPSDFTNALAIYAEPVLVHDGDATEDLAPVFNVLLETGWWERHQEDGGEIDEDFIEQLREQGKREGWLFEVNLNPATNRSKADLAGTNPDLRPPDEEIKYLTMPKKDPKALPSVYDLRTMGPAVPIRDQGQCGSCWAFALIGVAERLVAIRDGLPVRFSEQWLLDCNTKDWSCGGGWNAYSLLIDEDGCNRNGVGLGAVFPYREARQTCDCNALRTGPYGEFFHYLGTIKETVNPADAASPDMVNAIKQMVFDQGPVWTTVNSYHAPFLAYSGGVFNVTPPNARIDHAVVIEGWDDDKGVWIMRNSWSELWGDAGYMYIKYGSSLIGSYADVISYDGTQNGSITLVLGPSAALQRGAQWRLDDSAWLDSGVVIPNVLPGEYTLSYKGIEGFETPEPELVEVIVGDGRNISITRVYAPVSVDEGETPEGEGEGEGEDEVEGEGEGEGEGEEEGEPDIPGEECTGCRACLGCCPKSFSGEGIQRQVGDLLLVGVTLLALLALSSRKSM